MFFSLEGIIFANNWSKNVGHCGALTQLQKKKKAQDFPKRLVIPILTFEMAQDNQTSPSGFYYLASAASFAVSGISGLVSYYQRQQLKALDSAVVIKVRHL